MRYEMDEMHCRKIVVLGSIGKTCVAQLFVSWFADF